MSKNNVFNYNFYDLNLIFYINDSYFNSSTQLSSPALREIVTNSVNEEETLLFKETPLNINKDFLERHGINLEQTLGSFDPTISGGTYRMRRRKRAREEDRALSSSSYPYRPITSEIPHKRIKLDKKPSIKLLHWNVNYR